jgi:hypothetical protein
MGWAGGSCLMDEIIASVQAEVADVEVRRRIYGPIFEAFRSEDWDTVEEALRVDDAFDAIVKDEYPDWFDDEDDADGGAGLIAAADGPRGRRPGR